MRTKKTRPFCCVALVGLVLCARAVQAKVIFTGYGDMQATAESRFKIEGPSSILSTFNLGPGYRTSNGMSLTALGLFASTSLSDETRVLMDVTYRDIGINARTIRVQYAYLEHQAYGSQFQVGKITLPFGWFNQNKFYGFQRASITAPTFQGGILGLPIADIGATARKTFDLGETALTADIYAVNGYGPVSTSTTSFRNAGLPGGLTIANSITGSNANHRIALGGRVDAAHSALPDSSVGASYYRGEWGNEDHRTFQMAGAHLRGSWAGFELLGEYLYMRARGDQGLRSNLASDHWRTDGFFVNLDYTKLSAFSRPLTVWTRFDDYFTHGGSPGLGREALWTLAGGGALRLRDGILLKFEASRLYYRIPYVDLGSIELTGYSVLFGMTVTF